MRPVYGIVSVLFFLLSALCLALTLNELPRNDGVNGNYLNIMLAYVGEYSPSAHELRALSPFAITEARIVTILFVVAMLSACYCILAGLVARRRGEHSALYAGPVAMGVLLLLVGYEYDWLIAW